MTDYLLVSLLIFAGMVVPGPSKLRLMSLAAKRGQATAMSFAAGLGLGSLAWSLIAIWLVSTAVTLNPTLSTALATVSAIYLGWLAFALLRPKAEITDRDQPETASIQTGAYHRQIFAEAIFIHLSNPKTAIAWCAIIGTVSRSLASERFILFCAFISCAISLLGHATYAWMFSREAVRNGYRANRRVIEIFLAVAYGAFAVGLIYHVFHK